MQMEFLGFEMLQSVVIPPLFFSRVSPEGAGSKALFNAIDKQRAAERDSLARPQGTDRRGAAAEHPKGHNWH